MWLTYRHQNQDPELDQELDQESDQDPEPMYLLPYSQSDFAGQRQRCSVQCHFLHQGWHQGVFHPMIAMHRFL